MVLRTDIGDEKERQFREYAMKKFGYKKGSISEALNEAIDAWIDKQKNIDTFTKELYHNDKNVFDTPAPSLATVLKQKMKVEVSLEELKQERMELSEEVEYEDIS